MAEMSCFLVFYQTLLSQVVSVDMPPIAIKMSEGPSCITAFPTIQVPNIGDILELVTSSAPSLVDGSLENIHVYLSGNLESTLLSALIPQIGFQIPIAR